MRFILTRVRGLVKWPLGYGSKWCRPTADQPRPSQGSYNPGRCPSPFTACAACAPPRRCAAWSAKPASTPASSSCRCSSAPAKASAAKSAPCRGNYQLSVDELVKECAEVQSLGIGGVILFGLPESKDEMASGAYDDDGIVQRAIRAIRSETPAAGDRPTSATASTPATAIAAIVKDGDVDNDTTLDGWPKSAVSHARAGADIVAPSDMMDGRVGAIRQALDAHGFAKTPDPGLRRQIRLGLLRPVPRSRRFHARSSATAAATRWTPPTAAKPCAKSSSISKEGADMIMVKPAMPYLDLICQARAGVSTCPSPPTR